MDYFNNCCKRNCDRRTLSKTALWRIIASTVTFLAAYILSGEVKEAGGIMLIDASAKTLIYYLHEIAWKSCWPEIKDDVKNNETKKKIEKTLEITNI